MNRNIGFEQAQTTLAIFNLGPRAPPPPPPLAATLGVGAKSPSGSAAGQGLSEPARTAKAGFGDAGGKDDERARAEGLRDLSAGIITVEVTGGDDSDAPGHVGVRKEEEVTSPLFAWRMIQTS